MRMTEQFHKIHACAQKQQPAATSDAGQEACRLSDARGPAPAPTPDRTRRSPAGRDAVDGAAGPDGVRVRAQLWGKRRGIYSNVNGYLGGVNYAMMVTYVCMLYPKACASTIVVKFFSVFSQWPWGLPVRLTEIKTGGPMAQMVWDPATNRRDAAAIFPIITPCYPASNSTYNVLVRCGALSA